MVFTKIAMDSLPIIQTKMGTAPCATSTEYQAVREDQFYPLEHEIKGTNLALTNMDLTSGSTDKPRGVCHKSDLTG